MDAAIPKEDLDVRTTQSRPGRRPRPDLHDASQDAVLDVQAIPHFVRHAAILGALSSLNPGFSLTIKASHLPAPLLAQVDRLPGAFDYEVLQDGPEFWFVRITRTAL